VSACHFQNLTCLALFVIFMTFSEFDIFQEFESKQRSLKILCFSDGMFFCLGRGREGGEEGG